MATLLPAQVLAPFNVPELASVAQDVECEIIAMVREAAG